MLTTTNLSQLCQRVVTRLLEAHAWGLLTEDELVRRVMAGAATAGETQESGLKILALQEYALALYQACGLASGPEATQRQERAYTELGRYLYGHARYWRSDWDRSDLQEATQHALVDIYEKRLAERVHEPKGFLAFALGRLRGAITHLDRKQKLGGQPVGSVNKMSEAQDGETPGDWEPELPDHSVLSPEQAVDEQELRQAIVTELRRKYQLHPKAEQQLNAALLKHMFKYSNEEVAHQLKIESQGSVDTLIFRGKEKLRQNQELEVLYLHWVETQMRSDHR